MLALKQVAVFLSFAFDFRKKQPLFAFEKWKKRYLSRNIDAELVAWSKEQRDVLGNSAEVDYVVQLTDKVVSVE